jgi:metallo-beta-lactamase class B
MRGLVRSVLSAAAILAAAFAFPAASADGDNDPIPPFRIADSLYYVGASDIASYLVVTNNGLVLIDGGYEKTAPIILRNIRTLGFDPSQVKLLLNTHAHLDHAGGLAALKKETGAQLFAMEGDAELLERGGKGDFGLGDSAPYPPVKVDRVIKDGQVATVGGVGLVARKTAGHTRGCTTWTFQMMDTRGSRRDLRNIMLLCSNSVLSMYKLVGQESYPGIAADYEKSYAFWKSQPCDILIGSHGRFFDMQRKRRQIMLDQNPFADPAGCKAFFEKGHEAFKAELAKQQAAAAPKP